MSDRIYPSLYVSRYAGRCFVSILLPICFVALVLVPVVLIKNEGNMTVLSGPSRHILSLLMLVLPSVLCST